MAMRRGGASSRVHESPHSLSFELRNLRLSSGGRGAFILVAPDHPSGERWISAAAQALLVRAAARLGFGDESEGWYAVARSLAHGGLSDLISEAVEEAESDVRDEAG